MFIYPCNVQCSMFSVNVRDAETTYMIEVERLFHFSSVRYILIIDVKDIQWSFTHHVIVRI